MAAAVFAVVTCVILAPLLHGQTLSEVATYQSWVYPWAGSATAAHGTGPAITHWDQLDTFYPWQVFMSRAMHAHQIPLWNPYEFGGIPFFANGQNGLLYPPRFLLAETVSPLRVHDALAITHVFGAGVAMYATLAWFRRSWFASVFGACAWMTSSFLLAWLALEHFLVIAVWLPPAMLLADYVVRRRSLIAGLGLSVVLAMLFLGGNALFVELSFITIAAFAATAILSEVIADRRRGAERPLSSLWWGALVMAGAWIVMIGLVAVQLAPNIELLTLTARSGLTYAEAAGYALPPALLRDIFLPPVLDGTPDSLHTVYHEALFVGTPTALLGVIALFTRSRVTAFAGALSAIVILVMLRTPVTYAFYRVVPGFDSLKPLARASFLLCFAVALLGAFGMDRIATLATGRWHSRRVLQALVAVAALCIVVVVWQAKTLARTDLPSQAATPESVYPSTALIDRIQTLDHPRVLPFVRMLRGSTAVIFQISSASGYESLVPRRVARFWDVVGGASPQQAETQQLISAYEPQYDPSNVRYDLLSRAGVTDLAMIAGSAPPAASSPGLHGADEPTLSYDGTDGRLYHVAGAAGLVSVLGGCRAVGNDRDALRVFTDARFAASTTLLLEQPVPSLARYCTGSGSAPGRARVISSGVNTFVARATLRRPGMLLLRVNAYPGWHARVDGKDAKLVRADYLFQAVPLDPGTHRVELTFAPRSFRVGAAISLVTLLLVVGALGALLFRRRRGRRVRPSDSGH